ncbi:class I SAM-dependent methyltransferase [Gilvimarinus agarilyticus]|uniref:methyltransferase domain-containing protein n=1 Tax=Gilvimarinus sp. 2_MG-2023 TaxID=3062666 RepID=UPI001C08C6CA|nr:class I SAM-dependent methyltransferase [Gilvimarinus sp. 2_MG-2023]MBU2885055.1 class I SAM-dependent methyltransferase [Gilvimarinus agarilyticus]MDO6569952.1 class I SAM-dependent methyltransferase [Gilvimarinus sp. 2_MG-2023]
MLIYQSLDEFGQRCEVRRAGQSLRLYTDGTFHSQFNPARLIENNLWDLLWLPALLPAVPPRRVLVLGVGGGAVMRKLQKILPNALLVGVDISAEHLRIARKVFGVKGRNVLLLEADALAFVRHYRGPAFDLIIDDLFATNGGEPQRVVAMDSSWLGALNPLLSARGQLTVNFAACAQYRQALPVVTGQGSFSALNAWQHRRFENTIGSFTRQLRPASTRLLLDSLTERLKALAAGPVPCEITLSAGSV